MSALAEAAAGALTAARRLPPSAWWWRLAMLACGGGAQLFLVLLDPTLVLAVVGIVVVGVAVAVPRTAMPLVAGIVLVIQAAAIGIGLWPAVLLAVLLLGWHLCATALSFGRPWARVSRSVWRALGAPTAFALAGLAVSALAAWGAGMLEFGSVALLTIAMAVLAAAGLVVVLWPPADQTRESRRK
ncbi:hypothetical protein ACFQRL_04880 [Microbacterium fluvii]|uniref:Uncharacterized protein n=1 Tax=Microbacterium fluvii TaxID=415215 RepID=A0ABW2HEE7_9MICO|nr:hypothetical protein [Microbacterium fluvii]MCU4671926.1 hypothetical protein [Microbacterium fluvii]